MRHWKKWIFQSLLISAPLSFALALDIPLEGASGTNSGAVSIGYVDMEKIFQLYPQTQYAKEDYAKQLNARKDDLAKREADLQNIKNRIAVLESTVKNIDEPTISSDTAAVPAGSAPRSPQNLSSLRRELDDKQAEYEEARKRSQAELVAFEKRQSQVILGKLYQALQDLAQEEQITIVVDKSSILYGAANIDLTEKLQNKVRGY